MSTQAAAQVGVPTSRWKPYPEYKDSGVEWLGEIPAHWKVTLLKREFSVQLGKMLQSSQETENDTLEPYLRAANIFWAGVDLSDVREMWLSPYEKEQYSLEEGDLLVSEGGDVGRTAIWKGELDNCYIQNAINRVRSKGSHSTTFLYYWIYALKHLGYIDILCNKATISHFTAEKVESILLILPQSLSEQHAITTFLDRETAKIDTLVVKKERLLELLTEKRTALISHAVTKGLDPNVPMKDSGIGWLGEIPEHWKVKRLRYLTPDCRPIMYGIVLPGPHFEGGVPIVKGGNVNPDHLRLEVLNRTNPEIEASYIRSRLRSGDIVYAIRGSIGMAELVPSELEGANLTQDAARVSPKDNIDREWLLFSLKSQAVYAQLDAGALGATIRGVNIRDLKRAILAVPPGEEQRSLAGFLNNETAKIDALMAKVRDAIERLKEYRTALISAAVTGKIDVREEISDYGSTSKSKQANEDNTASNDSRNYVRGNPD